QRSTPGTEHIRSSADSGGIEGLGEGQAEETPFTERQPMKIVADTPSWVCVVVRRGGDAVANGNRTGKMPGRDQPVEEIRALPLAICLGRNLCGHSRRAASFASRSL